MLLQELNDSIGKKKQRDQKFVDITYNIRYFIETR